MEQQAIMLCYGSESYLLEEFILAKIKTMVPEDQRDLAVMKYDLTETPLDDVLDDAETAPFLVDRKIIVARNAMFFTGAKESGKVEHRVERLLDYIKRPVADTMLIFTVPTDKLDERKKIVKQMKEQKNIRAFPPLSADELIRWVNRKSEGWKVKFAAGAAEQFVLYVGTNLQTLSGELEKCSLYVGERGTITVEMIDQLVVRSTEQNVFILIEDIVQQRIGRGLTLFYELLKQKEEPIKIVMLMARQFRMILQVKDLLRAGSSHQQIAGSIGAHPYAVKIAAEQGKRYTQEKLGDILSGLADLDFQIKSGQIDKNLGLELLILRLGKF